MGNKNPVGEIRKAGEKRAESSAAVLVVHYAVYIVVLISVVETDHESY